MTIPEIENPILERDFVRARKEIRKYLKASRFSDESRLMAAIYYRWMGDFTSALKLLSKYGDIKKIEKASKITLLLQMEFARVLTYLGGEDAALKITERIQTVHPGKAREQYAYLCLWFEMYGEALPYFEPYTKLKDSELISEESYDNRDKILHAAVCHSCLGDFGQAQKLLERVLRLSNEPNMRMRIYTELASNSYLKKDYKSALEESSKAVSLSEKLTGSYPPYSETFLTHAMTLIFCGQYAEADRILKCLIPQSLTPGISANRWLSCLRWKGLLDFKTKGVFPEAWMELLIYPKKHPSFYVKEIKEFSKTPETILVRRAPIHTKQESTHYDLASDTVTIRRANGKESHQWGTTLLDRAVCMLLCAGERGVSQYLFYDLLWLGDVSIDQSKRRIAQVLARLRNKGLPITWENAQITLTRFDQMTCLWSNETRPRGWNFLEKHAKFSRTDLQGFFSLSKSAALEVCSYWIEKKLIKKVTEGRLSSYKVIEQKFQSTK